MSRAQAFLKRNVLHLLFGLSILSLASLLAWWSIFIERSILERRELLYEVTKSEMRIRAIALDGRPEAGLRPGVLAEDPRFEIVACGANSGPLSVPLRNFRGFCIEPRPGVLEKIDSKTRSLKVMRIGESSLLALIVLASIFFLYRNIRVERRSLREVQEFWERTAHEIKTPITGVKSFLQNLKGRAESLGEMSPFLDLALKQVERQESLAENILAGYSLDLGISRLRRSSIELAPFLDGYFLQDAPHLYSIKVLIDLGPGAETKVQGDSWALRVILDNITTNALKYAEGPLVFSVNVAREKNAVVVTLEDNGPGFDERIAENMFEAFKHPDPELPGNRHGTGLGLYISRRLARAMGGDLWAASPGPGRGARFFLRLKVRRDGK